MKISVIGAGNVGGTAAMRIAQERLGEVVLVDIAEGLAKGKAADINDARNVLMYDSAVYGTGDISAVGGSDIVVFTAGLARKPGMTREDLLNKNAAILKEACLKIKESAPGAILIIVTNPLDLMTALALRVTGFDRNRVIGMGMTLDASRFANILSEKLNVPASAINACVIGSHGEGMIPLPRFTKIDGKPLTRLLDVSSIEEAVKRTVGRGQEIVSYFGNGSAFFAPSAAICDLVKIIALDTRRVRGVSVMLEGEYGLRGVCIGVPCRIGRSGVQEVMELELDARENEKLRASAEGLKGLFSGMAL
ncbi:MAG: malate dehydrogenase [Candidatus Omnitrophota bacterium]|jgi:malate dehydrogenase